MYWVKKYKEGVAYFDKFCICKFEKHIQRPVEINYEILKSVTTGNEGLQKGNAWGILDDSIAITIVM